VNTPTGGDRGKKPPVATGEKNHRWLPVKKPPVATGEKSTGCYR
jgi:hypothetical protein